MRNRLQKLPGLSESGGWEEHTCPLPATSFSRYLVGRHHL
ncbi:hypothetical protein LEMLEM_LOCUS7117 [Lemmus lemmus]